jgi:hypothetical protein
MLPLYHRWIIDPKWHLDYLRYITDNSLQSIDTNLRMRLGVYPCCLYPNGRPTHRLWMSATGCVCGNVHGRAKNIWRSIDSHDLNGEVTMLLFPLPIIAANSSVIHSSNKISVQLLNILYQNLFLPRYCSFLNGWCDLPISTFTMTTANTSMMDKGNQGIFQIPNLHHQLSLTLCWCLLSLWGSAHVPFSGANQGCQVIC